MAFLIAMIMIYEYYNLPIAVGTKYVTYAEPTSDPGVNIQN